VTGVERRRRERQQTLYIRHPSLFETGTRILHNANMDAATSWPLTQ